MLAMSYDTINRWLSRIDKDSEEERQIAVQNLYLQGYTLREIADAVGMPFTTVEDVCTRICNYEIPYIPGLFTENQPEDGAPERVSTEIAPFDQQTSPAEIRKRVTAYLQKLENPAKGKQFLDYVKASKHIGWLVQNAAKKKEIYAAEIFTCWKLAELVDEMPKNPGQLKQGPTL